MEYGIQLYGVRDLAEQNFATAVYKMKELGYSFVETAGFFGYSPKEINELMNDSGLSISGTHSSFNDLLEHFDETVAYHKAIGNRFYIIPAYKLDSQERLDQFVQQVNVISPLLKKEGIILGYHNHANELIPNEDGSLVFDQLYYRTDLMFEIDTFWAYVGMGNPVKLLERVKERVSHIHIKDGFKDGRGMPLGKGEAPVRDIYKAAIEMNLPIIVESETCNPDGVAEAEICIDFLRSME